MSTLTIRAYPPASAYQKIFWYRIVLDGVRYSFLRHINGVFVVPPCGNLHPITVDTLRRMGFGTIGVVSQPTIGREGSFYRLIAAPQLDDQTNLIDCIARLEWKAQLEEPALRASGETNALLLRQLAEIS